jgi:hypothetical protein
LNEDRKRDDGKADGNDPLALRDFGRKPKSKGKRPLVYALLATHADPRGAKTVRGASAKL